MAWAWPELASPHRAPSRTQGGANTGPHRLRCSGGQKEPQPGIGMLGLGLALLLCVTLVCPLPSLGLTVTISRSRR